jgi:hypothetical protein
MDTSLAARGLGAAAGCEDAGLQARPNMTMGMKESAANPAVRRGWRSVCRDHSSVGIFMTSPFFANFNRVVVRGRAAASGCRGRKKAMQRGCGDALKSRQSALQSPVDIGSKIQSNEQRRNGQIIPRKAQS